MAFEQVIRTFFSELSSHGIECCVLRNYSGMPKKRVGNDIDMLLRERDLRFLTQIFGCISKRYGVNAFLAENHNHGVRVFLYRLNPLLFIKLDIHVDESWRGAIYFDAKEILSRKKAYECFYVPDPIHEAVILLMSSLLAGGKVSSKYIGGLRDSIIKDEKSFTECMDVVVGSKCSSEIFKNFERGNIQNIESRVGHVRRSLWFTSFRRRGLTQVIGVTRYLKHQIRRRLLPKGFLLQVCMVRGPEKRFNMFRNYLDESLAERFPGLQTFAVERCSTQPVWKYYLNIYNALISYDIVLTEKQVVSVREPIHTWWLEKLYSASRCFVSEKAVKYSTKEFSWSDFVDNYCDKLVSHLPVINYISK